MVPLSSLGDFLFWLILNSYDLLLQGLSSKLNSPLYFTNHSWHILLLTWSSIFNHLCCCCFLALFEKAQHLMSSCRLLFFFFFFFSLRMNEYLIQVLSCVFSLLVVFFKRIGFLLDIWNIISKKFRAIGCWHNSVEHPVRIKLATVVVVLETDLLTTSLW